MEFEAESEDLCYEASPGLEDLEVYQFGALEKMVGNAQAFSDLSRLMDN